MKTRTWLLCLAVCSVVYGENAQENRGQLVRRYREGDKLTYHMKGINEGRPYEIHATGIVKRDSAGNYAEEYAWSNLTRNGAPVTLPPASVDFRQTVSLDPELTPSIPNLALVHPAMIGPILDLLTFYADLWLAMSQGKLAQAGDRFLQESGVVASWADGTNVLIGEDAIDFEVTLTNIDETSQVATVVVRHVPARQPAIQLPAPWMREPVADTANNWVQVQRTGDKYVAAVGKETFDVQMKVRLEDGVILSGTLDNPVETSERECTDAALMNCGPARSRRILRQIEISLER